MLLSSSKTTAATVKVVDFGSATKEQQKVNGRTFPYTPGYTAPEFLVAASKNGSLRMDPSFDMWGLAVIVYSKYFWFVCVNSCVSQVV